MTLEELVVKVDADTRDLQRGMRQVDTQMKGMARTVNRTTGPLQSLNDILIALGAATAAIKLGELGKEMANLAIAAEDAGRKFDVVFGAAAENVRDTLADLSSRIPLTRGELEAMAAGIQDLLVPMGLARGEAGELTTEFIRVAGALAEFNGRPIVEAMDAIRSAIVGEFEPLRRLGVALDVTELEAIAAAQGITDLGKDMSDAERTTALLAGILERSNDALVAFDSGARSARGDLESLDAVIRGFKEAVGQFFVPAIHDAAEAMREGEEASGDFQEELGDLSRALGEMAVDTATNANKIGVSLTDMFAGVLRQIPILRAALPPIIRLLEDAAQRADAMARAADRAARNEAWSEALGNVRANNEALEEMRRKTEEMANAPPIPPPLPPLSDVATAADKITDEIRDRYDALQTYLNLHPIEIDIELAPNVQRQLDALAGRIETVGAGLRVGGPGFSVDQLADRFGLDRVREALEQQAAQLESSIFATSLDSLGQMSSETALELATMKSELTVTNKALAELGKGSIFQQAGTAITGTLGGIAGSISGFLGPLFTQIAADVARDLGTAFAGLAKGTANIKDVLNATLQSVIGSITDTLAQFVPVIGSLIDGFFDAIFGPTETQKRNEQIRTSINDAFREAVVLGEVPGVEPTIQAFHDLDDEIRDVGVKLKDEGISMQTAIQAVTDNFEFLVKQFEGGATIDEATQALLEELRLTTEGFDELNSELRNLPTGLKVFNAELLRFQTTMPEPRLRPGGPITNGFAAPTETVVRDAFHIDQVTINAAPGEDGEQLLGRLEKAASERSVRGGTTVFMRTKKGTI